MKQAMLCFTCDECGEESDTWPHWSSVRRQAKKDGWWLGKDGAALCPEHRPGGQPEGEVAW